MIAFTYVVVLTHPPEGVGMNVAKIHKNWELKKEKGEKFVGLGILMYFTQSWSFGQGHLVIFDFGNAVIAHYI